MSSKTREGLDELLVAIQEAASKAERIHDGTAMRYPIDRVFTIKGAGTVLTGTLWSGTASPNDVVEILPSKKQARIRSIQIHGNSVDTAYPGNRVAINLGNVKLSDVHPGDFLAQVGAIEPSDRFDAYITYIDNNKTGKSIVTGAPMHIAHGTREVVGRILLENGMDELAPGASTVAQFRLEEPLALSYGDRFVMRTYSPVLLAGGGRILLAHPRKRTMLSEEERALRTMLCDGDLFEAAICVTAIEDVPLAADAVAHMIGIEPERAGVLLEKAVAQGRLVALDASIRYYATPQAIASADDRIGEATLAFHEENPKAFGIAKEALRRKCFPKMPSACFNALLTHAMDNGVVVQSDALVAHPLAFNATQAAEQDAADKLYPHIQGTGLTPPALEAIAQEVGIDMPLARKAMARLCEQKRVWEANPDLYFDFEAYEECKRIITEHFAAGGEGTVAALRDALGMTRKYVVPLLEGLDRDRFTRRFADNSRRLEE